MFLLRIKVKSFEICCQTVVQFLQPNENMEKEKRKINRRKEKSCRLISNGCCLQITNANEALVQASQQSYSRSWKFNLTKKFSEIMFEKYSHQKLVLKFVLYNFTQFFFHKTSKRDIPSKKTEEVTKIFFVLTFYIFNLS